MLNKNVEKNIRIMFPENAEDRTQRILKRLRDDKAKDEHVPGSLTWIGRCAVDHAAADLIEQLGTDNAQLLEKVDRFSKVAFEQNMVILGKQDVITKQERVRANLQDEIWQLQQQVPRWISVEERLPEDCKHVLVFMRRNFIVGWSIDYWHIDTDWLDDGNWSKHPAGGYYNITHWMPLPEPPKEEVNHA